MTLDWLTYFPSPPRGVWHLGPIPIRAYAMCIIVGIIAALLIGDRRWRARGGEPGVIYDIALWTVPFGLVGGRLYHLATDWQTYFGPGGVGWAATPRIWDGGLGIWGAVALGGVGTWIACRRRKIPLPAFADAVAPGVILAQAIGRIGNYFNQELYGRETSLPWGMEIFWREDAAGLRDPHLLDGVSTGVVYKIVQPTFAYELLWNLLVFALLLIADRRFRMGHGRLFALYVAGYCVGRFGVELLRDDAATHIAGIRINSFTATFVFIGAVVYLLVAPKGREDPEQLRRTWDVEPEEPAEPAAATEGEGGDAEALHADVPEPEPALVGAAGVGDKIELSEGIAARLESAAAEDGEDEADITADETPEEAAEAEPDAEAEAEAEAEVGAEADAAADETPEEAAPDASGDDVATGDEAAETAPESEPEPAAEQTDAAEEGEAEAAPEPDAEAETEVGAEADAEPEAVEATETPADDTEPAAEPDSASTDEAEAEATEAAAETEPDAAPQGDTEAELETEADAEPEAEPDSASTDEAESAAEVEPAGDAADEPAPET